MGKLATATLSEEDGKLQLQCATEGSGAALNVDAIDRMIEVLGQFRAGLQPPVRTSDPVTGETVQAVTDPRWWISAEPMNNGALLQLRHPGLGWLGFALPLESLKSLQENVNRIVPMMEQLAQQTRPN